MDQSRDTSHAASDEALLARYARGDRAAALELTQRLVPPVLRFAARMLGDQSEAEDVAQEAMLRLWRQAPDWRAGAAKPSTWLYRVAANLCTDRLRQRRRGAQVRLDAVAEPEDPGASAAAGMLAAQRAAALQIALETLPERQQQAVILRHVEGLANTEIAQIMDTGIEAVESLTARGKRALRSALLKRRPDLGFDDDRI